MTQYLPSIYQLRKVFFWPRTTLMRWKFRHVQQSLRTMLELHYYSPGIVNFLGATVMNPQLLHEANIDEHSTVLDVGAFVGKWTQRVAELYDPLIYAFEPNPNSFSQLQDYAGGNPKVRPLQYGLGERDETAEFTLKGLGSSMFEERAEHAAAPRTQVHIRAIDAVWKELQLDRVDLMKINIEGAEFPLLERMIEVQLLDRVECFLIQFHEWHPGAHGRRRRIQRALQQSHRLEWNYDFVWEKWVRK